MNHHALTYRMLHFVFAHIVPAATATHRVQNFLPDIIWQAVKMLSISVVVSTTYYDTSIAKRAGNLLILNSDTNAAFKHISVQCSKMKMCGLSLEEVQQFYAVHQGKPFYDTLTSFMSSGRVVAMELVRDGESQLCVMSACCPILGYTFSANPHL